MSVRYDPDCLICQLRAAILLDLARRSRVMGYVTRELFIDSLQRMTSLRRDLDSLCEYPHTTT